MRVRMALLASVGVLALALTACGGDDSGDDASAYDSPPATEQPATDDPASDPVPATAVSVGETDLGAVLVDPDGLTLYGFTNDTAGVSTCYDACATTWPALSAGVEIGEGLDPASFRSAGRNDGTSQLAIGDWPLYTFSGDSAPGDANGQGSGGVWFAVASNGTLIK